MSDYQDYFTSRRWLPWVNFGDTTCPAFGLVTFAEIGTLDNYDVQPQVLSVRNDSEIMIPVSSRSIATLAGSTGDGIPGILGHQAGVMSLPHPREFLGTLSSAREFEVRSDRGYFFGANSPWPVKPGKSGMLSLEWPAWVLQSGDSDDINVGEMCGAELWNWKLTKTEQTAATQFGSITAGDTVTGIATQFTVLNRIPFRVTKGKILEVTPYRSPMAELFAYYNPAVTETIAEGTPDWGSPTLEQLDAAALSSIQRVPETPRNGLVATVDLTSVTEIDAVLLKDPGLYFGIFQASVGVSDATELQITAYAEDAIEPTDSVSITTNIHNEKFTLDFDTSHRRNVYLPFYVEVKRPSSIYVRATGIPSVSTITFDNPTLSIERIGHAS